MLRETVIKPETLVSRVSSHILRTEVHIRNFFSDVSAGQIFLVLEVDLVNCLSDNMTDITQSWPIGPLCSGISQAGSEA